MFTTRTHPFQILVNIKKVLYLFVVPAVRAIFALVKGDFMLWTGGIWKDALILLFIVLISVYKWLNYTLSISKSGVELSFGVITKVNLLMPLSSICVVSSKINVLLKPFGCVCVRCDTPAGKSRTADIAVLLRQSTWEKIKMLIPCGKNYERKVYKPQFAYLLLLAAVTSNSFTGVLLISVAISKLGKALGKGFEGMVYGSYEQLAKALAFGIEPAAAGAAILLLSGWLITFLRGFADYYDFSVALEEKVLTVKSGWLQKNEWIIDLARINHIDICQTLYTHFLKLYTVFVCSYGYGKKRSAPAAVVPVVKKQRLEDALKCKISGFSLNKFDVRPVKGSLFRFVWQPLAAAAVVAAAIGTVPQFFDAWLGVMAAVPLLWMAAVRAVDCFTCGAAMYEDILVIRTSQRLKFHTAVIHSNKAVMMKTTQSIFQRRKNSCDLWVYPQSEEKHSYRLRNVSTQNAEDIIGKIIVKNK
ncbi:MAG: PH domain-containing protein [Oscillospiraceae bacterium]|nr:PH domain-containing protein [Oscillospiraceae bacterium]